MSWCCERFSKTGQDIVALITPCIKYSFHFLFFFFCSWCVIENLLLDIKAITACRHRMILLSWQQPSLASHRHGYHTSYGYYIYHKGYTCTTLGDIEACIPKTKSPLNTHISAAVKLTFPMCIEGLTNLSVNYGNSFLSLLLDVGFLMDLFQLYIDILKLFYNC